MQRITIKISSSLGERAVERTALVKGGGGMEMRPSASLALGP